MLYYSKTTNGFYHEEITPARPADAVAITAEEHRALLRGQAEGRVLTADADGKPVLVASQAGAEEERRRLVNEARERLRESDVWVIRLLETGAAAPPEVRAYREQLRAVARGDLTTLPAAPVSIR